jgi:hypothetical protein
VKWGDGQITELVLTPTARSLRGVELKLNEDGSIAFAPLVFGKVGLRMAGYNEAQVETLLDRLHAPDLMEVATGALGFLGDGRATGGTS